jgi:hypothetical protein
LVVIIVGLLVSSLYVALLAAISLCANKRLRNHDRLPMQWGANGRPTWSAPRQVALSFTPGLCAATTLPLAALFGVIAPPDEAVAVLVPLWLGSAWLAGHLLHLWLIRRWIDRSGA